MGVDRCPTCRGKFKRLSQHWATGSCEFPDIGNRHWEILTGLLMGDGAVDFSGPGNPVFQVDSTKRVFLEWLDTEFGCLSVGTRRRKTAEESAQDFRERKVDSAADAADYSDVYRWRSGSHPAFERFGVWYESGRKQFPDNLELTPFILKMWYIGHGNFREQKKSIRISCSKQSDREEYLCGLFDPLHVEPWLEVSERQDGSKMYTLGFTSSDAASIFEFMGPPMPGCEDMWPEDMCEQAEAARENVYVK